MPPPTGETLPPIGETLPPIGETLPPGDARSSFEGLGDSLLGLGSGRGETLPPSLEGLGAALVGAGPAAEAGAGGLGLHLLPGAL